MCVFIKCGIHVNYVEMMSPSAFGCQRSTVKVIYKCGVRGDATLFVLLYLKLVAVSYR